MPAEIENSTFLAFTGRIIKAAGRRVGNGDIGELAGLLAASRELDQAIADAVHQLNSEHGYSWAEIARETGTTKQAAHRRWAR